MSSLWDGFSATAQGYWNQGGCDGIFPVNFRLANSGIHGADRTDVAALYLQQNFSTNVSLVACTESWSRSWPLSWG